MKRAKKTGFALATIKVYYQTAKPYWTYGLLTLVTSPAGEIFSRLIPPLLIARMIDKLQNGRVTDVNDVAPLLILYIVSQLVGEAFLFRLNIWALNRFDGKVMRDLAKKAYDNLVDRSLQFHNNSFAGALVAKVNRFVNGFEPLADTIAFEVLTTFTIVIFTSVVLWSRSPMAVLAFVGIMAVFTVIITPLVRKQATYNREAAAADSEQTAQLADSLSNIATVKAFGREKFEKKRYNAVRETVLQKQLKRWDYANIPADLFTGVFVTAITSLTLIGAIYAATQSGQNISTVFLIVSYTAALAGKLWNFRRIIRRIEQVLSDSAEMTEILLLPPQVIDPVEPTDLNISRGDISFKNVTFSYADGRSNETLLKNFNLEIAAGEKVGLVGPSGGGKTTITKLLLRFMDIQKGSISIDGQDICQSSQRTLREQIACVPQEPLLFHRSLEENIRYGKLDASKPEIIKAAASAHAAEFIKKMPKGYDTLVGERGVKLSGGQRQRIAIARAMVKDAPVLILDEATSALDSESEKLIQDALWRLMEGRTAIVIAHRLSTIQRMDRIVVLKDGEVVEQGTHAQLLKHGGVYADLWAHQSGGFIEE